ncbi:uncharacterized protein LOC143033707 [Oratosquilla oratoria]|uniref:uncharacterized protein LOC143033707 n=1 Tax=Oratosquilla oratoria TaxID=337810 RepID=UPI003F770975
MDYFTKCPEAYTLPDHEAETAAGVLVSQFFTRFEVPRELHPDQGREPKSKAFRECCTLLVIAYQSAEHEATGYTPARFMFGRELHLAVDLATGRPPDEELPTCTTEYAVKIQQRPDDNRRKVSTSSKRGLSPKFQSAREGPYTFQEALSEVTYCISPRVGEQNKVVHVDRLWKYTGPGTFIWNAEEVAVLTSDCGIGSEDEAVVCESESEMDIESEVTDVEVESAVALDSVSAT